MSRQAAIQPAEERGDGAGVVPEAVTTVLHDAEVGAGTAARGEAARVLDGNDVVI
jgi:hypothetical protein